MKKIIILLLITFLTSFTSQAQFRKGGSHKIHAYKIAYLTEKLNLTQSEAQRFWPVYNKYDKKRIALHREQRFILKKRIPDSGGFEKLSEKESKDILEKIHAIKKEQYQIKTLFQSEVSKILSYKKILALQISEHKFNHKLIKKLRGKKKQ
ncbi:sensor of ECF-type sigma factor [Tenacibaculum finnmarkense]|uniref:sensor of ECF-type sigma factor n=1 Tax=Tenacibaculum finnmarkense TaxID=2781243 RepID=UPI000C6BE2B6|nr:sensor of ECF-type sigma factor [Tenacibaculum finnmarkense]MCG8769693.1 sensor of ECF-type sigma factor [Tenacibaculum finnmarkense]MCG8871752.1 sensor of ECF-type sigma factor [Tenacibaculum finnmarkense]SOS51198.1 conserved exported hypothetical protein [Tenacibaculum finnmarkense]